MPDIIHTSLKYLLWQRAEIAIYVKVRVGVCKVEIPPALDSQKWGVGSQATGEARFSFRAIKRVGSLFRYLVKNVQFVANLRGLIIWMTDKGFISV